MLMMMKTYIIEISLLSGRGVSGLLPDNVGKLIDVFNYYKGIRGRFF